MNVQTGVRIVGRERELGALHGLAVEGAPRPLVLVGAPGMGKTTLWEAGVAHAHAQGVRVLAARPGGGEGPPAYAGLVDLLDGIELAELAELPPPQRHALEVVLLRAVPAAGAAEPQAVRIGFLGALRSLAASGPLAIAVDDLQWLDEPSAGALAFAARRMDAERLRFLLARRPGRASELERALERWGLERLPVGALSAGAIRRLLLERLGLTMRRQLLQRMMRVTLGNPLFALELGRTLAEQGPPAIGADMVIPDAVEDLLGTRVDRLPAASRRLLLAVALSSDLRAGELAALADATDVDEAAGAGVLVLDGDHVRASHPLLAAAARQRSSARERQAVHRELAVGARDEQARARHLALATDQEDGELAALLAGLAAQAAARGATHDAVELGGHALRLTPPGDELRGERLLSLASALGTAGERQRVADLLAPALPTLAPGAPRVRALLLLAESGAVRSYADHDRFFENALHEAGQDRRLAASVLASKALNVAAEGVERIRQAEAWAEEALAAAPADEPDLARLALRALGWARSLRGLPIDDVCARFRAVSDEAAPLADSPEPVAGLRLVWRGELAGARALLEPFLTLADERGESVSYAWLRLNLCELGLRAGDWEAVARLLDEWAETAEGGLLIAPTYQRCRALVAAGRGAPDEALRWAEPALADAERHGYRWPALEARRALGSAALLGRDPGRAAEHLGAVWEHTVREGIDEPGAFPVAPDLVEALVELGELERAAAVARRLTRLAREQTHPWGLAAASRCAAVTLLAGAGHHEDAAAALAGAAAAFAGLGQPYEQGRTLLSLGRTLRRARKWGGARRALEEAATVFDAIGSRGWAAQARSETGRVGARRPHGSDELTPAEDRVVALAAGGLSNKEIARELVVTVNTVEAHLSRAYAKLGVRSRSQLAVRLSARDAGT